MAVLDVDIGVIYSGERNWIAPLLRSLSRSCNGVSARLMLVDNCAAKPLPDVGCMFPHFRVIKNDRRLGYAQNLNRILSASDARYILALNTDMRFDPGTQCVARMVQFMDAHPECGLAGCQVRHPNDAYAFSARRFPTLPMILARRLPLRAFPRALKRYLYGDRDQKATFCCDWVSGCFMMMRRAAVSEVGPLDQNYPKYFEDVDYCRRMARQGWRVMYYGGTHCYHFEQRASRKLFSADAVAHARSYLRWSLKWRLPIANTQ